MAKLHDIQVHLSKVAEILEGHLSGEDILVNDLCIPEDQKEGAICIIATKKNLEYAKEGKASAYIVTEGLKVETDKPIIYVKDARPTIVKLLNAIYPPKPVKHKKGKYVVIGKKTQVNKPCDIGNMVSIGSYSSIGKNTVINSNVTIGNNVTIGENCIIYPNVTIYDNITIGNNVIIHAGAVLGADGFGFIPGENPVKIPQKGTVIIEDFVEIGANTCIDRATIGETVIGFGTKLDDLVMVGHNTKLGKGCLIASQVGFSGSIEAGDYIIAGGQVGFGDHVKIATGAMFGGQAGIHNDVKQKGLYIGSPVMEFKKFAKASAIFEELPELKRRVTNLEK